MSHIKPLFILYSFVCDIAPVSSNGNRFDSDFDSNYEEVLLSMG